MTNVIATDLRRRGEKKPPIVKIYDQKDARLEERPARKVDGQRVIRQGGTVFAGELNSHSTRGDPRWEVQRDGVFWQGVIDENGQEIGKDSKPSHHWK
jgi:hypothetical protein